MRKSKTKLAEWQNRAKEEKIPCAKCGSTYNTTVDHIIPVSIVEQFHIKDLVYDWEENFEYLCYACNQMKRNSLNVKDERTFKLLAHLVKLSNDIHIKGLI